MLPLFLRLKWLCPNLSLYNSPSDTNGALYCKKKYDLRTTVCSKLFLSFCLTPYLGFCLPQFSYFVGYIYIFFSHCCLFPFFFSINSKNKMMNPLHQQNGIPMYSKGRNIHRQPVCCAVIPSKFGVPLVLTTWIVGNDLFV